MTRKVIGVGLVAGVVAFYNWITTPAQRLYQNPPYSRGEYKAPWNDRRKMSV